MMESHKEKQGRRFSLAEDLISLILSNTSSRDACRLSAVSTEFRSAAESNIVWECFLPSHYAEIISRYDGPLIFASKKDLYFCLYRSVISLDNYTKVLLLNSSQKICCGLPAKSLSVCAEHPKRYSWFILDLENRSDLVINFGHMFNIKGKMDTKLLSPNTTYRVYLTYKTTAVDGYNFNFLSSTSPTTLVSMELFKNGEIVKTSEFCINLVINNMRSSSKNEWTKLDLGEFFINRCDFDTVMISLKETERLYFYMGPAIIIFGVEFKPS